MNKVILVGLLAAKLFASDMPVATITPTKTPFPIVSTQQSQNKGLVPILCFHYVKKVSKFNTVETPEEVREMFSYLHKNDFYLTPLEDVIQRRINIPRCKKPVVITVDDNLDNPLFIKEYEEFTSEHPDFGRAATFFVSSPGKYLGHSRKRLQEILNRYQSLNIDIQPHGTEHKNLTSATIDEIKAEAMPIVNKLSSFCLSPRYYAVPYGNLPKSNEGLDFFVNGFSAVMLSNEEMYNLSHKGKLVDRIDVSDFETFKKLARSEKVYEQQ